MSVSASLALHGVILARRSLGLLPATCPFSRTSPSLCLCTKWVASARRLSGIRDRTRVQNQTSSVGTSTSRRGALDPDVSYPSRRPAPPPSCGHCTLLQMAKARFVRAYRYPGHNDTERYPLPCTADAEDVQAHPRIVLVQCSHLDEQPVVHGVCCAPASQLRGKF